jgi:hypothetical protein
MNSTDGSSGKVEGQTECAEYYSRLKILSIGRYLVRASAFEINVTKSACFSMDLKRRKLVSRRSYLNFVWKTRRFRNPNAIALSLGLGQLRRKKFGAIMSPKSL